MTSALAADGLLSIGEVLHSLRADFPDVSISKIRYLESEGLVEPSRTPSGYRKFSRADLDRLRFVLRMQRDNYMPLKVIREQLAGRDAGQSPEPAPAAGPVPRSLVVASNDDAPSGTDVRLARKELLEEAGISNEMLRDLESYGLVNQSTGGAFYDATDLQIAILAGKLAEFGYGPRHLRPFRLAADRELALVEQVVMPMSRGRHPDAASRAEEAANSIADLALQLHVCLVQAGLSRLLGH